MNRRKFVGTLGAATGAALILPQVARPFTYTRGTDISRALATMSAGLAATLDASLRLREPGDERPCMDCSGRGYFYEGDDGSLPRDMVGTERIDCEKCGGLARLPLVHWYEAPFFLTDLQLAEGPTDAMQYREALKALVNVARDRGITRFYPTYPPNPRRTWSPMSEARYGRAIARAQVERQHLRVRWSLSFLGA